MLPSDNWSKFGIAQIESANAFALALDKPKEAVVALKELVEDTSKLKILPEANARALLSMSDTIRETNRLMKEGKEGTEVYTAEIEKLKKAGTHYNYKGEAKSGKAKAMEAGLAYSQAATAKSLENFEKIQQAGIEAAAATYDAGSKKLGEALTKAIELGAINAQKALIGWTSGPGTSQAKANLDIQGVSLQIEQIKVQRELVIATTKLGLQYEKDMLSKVLKDDKATEADKSTAKRTLDNRINPALDVLNSLGTNNSGKFLKTLVDKSSVGAKAQLGGLVSSTVGSDAQIAAKEAEILSIRYKAQLDTISETYVAKRKNLDTDKESINEQLKSLELGLADKDLFNTSLALQREELRAKADAIDLESKSNTLREVAAKWAFTLSKTTGKNKELLEKAASSELDNLAKQVGLQSKLNDTSATERKLKDNEAAATASQYELTIRSKISDMEVEALGYKRDANLIDETSLNLLKAQLEVQKARDSYSSRIDKARADKQVDPTNSASYDATISKLERELKLEEAKIVLMAKYRSELTATEDTLRRLEKTGNYTQEYFGTVYQDFSNKVKDLAKNTKSAADTFNSGFINAIDSSIDKFFDMLQKSELTIKGLVDFARNALSDVFRDTASQLLKNAWKDALSGILPKSSAEKAQSRLILALDNLTAAVQGKSLAGSSGISTFGGSVLDTTSVGPETSSSDYNSQDAYAATLNAAEGFDSAATTQDKASSTISDAADRITFGKGGIMDFTKGNTTFGQTMFQVADKFLMGIPSLLVGIYNSISSAMSMSSASSGGGGGGIFGTLLNAGIGYLTGGWAGAAAGAFNGISQGGSSATGFGGQDVSLNMSGGSNAYGFGGSVPKLNAMAKGGVFDGSTSLSAYSNSIVNSPTMFAFAKGAGLMGEAGPEAIMPLKRDAQGNLGIRGGSGNTNNIDINITIQDGKASGEASKDSQSNTANQLGAAIKVAVTQELIKQSRPGGLLAK